MELDELHDAGLFRRANLVFDISLPRYPPLFFSGTYESFRSSYVRPIVQSFNETPRVRLQERILFELHEERHVPPLGGSETVGDETKEVPPLPGSSTPSYWFVHRYA
jgi:hypothetical protein